MSKDCGIAVYNSSSLNKQHVSYVCIHTCTLYNSFVCAIVYYIVCLMPHSIAQAFLETLKVYITQIPIVSSSH